MEIFDKRWDRCEEGQHGLMPGVQALASARGHMGTRTNQASCIDCITEKPYLNRQLGVPRAPISGY